MSEQRQLPYSAKITLKHLYRPYNLLYLLMYCRLTRTSKNNALLNLYEGNYIVAECINSFPDIKDFRICKHGIDMVEIIIEEDKKFFIPNFLSTIAILISLAAFIFSVLTYIG